MKFAAVLFIIAALAIAACTQQQPLQPQENKSDDKTAVETECLSDSDCSIGGCSGQVCTTAAEAEDLVTTCEYRAEYGCLKLTSCGCVDGKCGWAENPAFEKCVQQSRGKGAVY